MQALTIFHKNIPFHNNITSSEIREKEMASNGREKALVVCSERSAAVGITVWDVETGQKLLRIPTCAAAAHGLICLRNHQLVASQVNRHGSTGPGSIFMWAINKPHPPLRSYTMEAIGPICCTRDGAYLAGGASSGNIYLWEVASGRLLKSWPAHHKSVKCMTFSDDGSLLISGSDDGVICVWSMISLLDIGDSRSLSSLLHWSSEHLSSVSGLLTVSATASFISSSLDGTCKVWDLISGRLVKTKVYESAITAIAIHPAAHFLFSGSLDGSIFVDMIDNEVVEDPSVDKQGQKDQPTVLQGHNGSITALSFSNLHLISASTDCTVCLWDIESWVIIQRFNHQKGPVTNLVIVPRSSLLAASENETGFDQSRVSMLEKYPQALRSTTETITHLPSFSCPKDDQTSVGFQRTTLLDQQQEDTAEGMQMKVETAVQCRTWAMSMAKHVVEMNKHIRSCLLDMMQLRLWPEEINSTEATNKMRRKKKKKIKAQSPGIEMEEQESRPRVIFPTKYA